MIADKILGHTEILKRLKRIVEEERIAPAYLFSGQEGIGKRIAATMFAASILCKKNVFPPCGVCDSCKPFLHGNHPDFTLLQLEKTKKIIPIETVRDAVTMLSLKPFLSRRRVLLIDDIDCSKEETANTLLKILEEPPAYGVIILVTGVPTAIVPTIQSRCQHIIFPPLRREEVKSILMQKCGIEQRMAEDISTIAFGSISNALRMIGAKDDGNIEKMKAVLKKLNNFELGNIVGEIVPKNAGEELRDFARTLVDYLLLAIRTAILYKLGALDRETALFDDNFVKDYGAMDLDALTDMLDKLCETRRQIDANANVNIALPNVLVQMARES